MEVALMSKNEEFEEVLRFWFSSLPTGDHPAMARQMEWWFRGGADVEIIERFSPLFVRAILTAMKSWDGNQPKRNSSTSQPANLSTPIRCQHSRRLIIEARD